MKEINLDIISRDKTGKSNCKQLRNIREKFLLLYMEIKKNLAYIAIEYPKIVKELCRTGFFSTVFSV